ncbi:Cullin-domain-containing protein [Zalerion maritima]|uniref:Cullin-domain-containing protein n=1 Tax=Zalerion maritima TaxID=339359 RepID=A0AAD5WTG0_9PEZI|nr:Cullin-domain-containing protein [Zalerion maritima]
MGMRSSRQNPDRSSSISSSPSSSSASKRRHSRGGGLEQASSINYGRDHNPSATAAGTVAAVPPLPPQPPPPPPPLSTSDSTSLPTSHIAQHQAQQARNLRQSVGSTHVPADRRSELIGPDSHPHVPKRPKLSQCPSASPTMSKIENSAKPMGGAALSSPLRPHTGAKKLVVKNLRPANPAREAAIKEYYATLHLDVQDALNSIFDGKVPSRPYDGLYKGVEDLCRSGHSEELYKTIKMKMEDHLTAILTEDLQHSVRNSLTQNRAIGVVRTTLSYWKKWSKQTATVRNVFSFLDRSYLLHSRKHDHQQLNDLAISLFKSTMFAPRSNGERVVTSVVLDGMCILVQHEREDHAAKDTQLLKDAISMMNVLTLYTRLFEPAFLSKSRSYFANLVRDYADTYSLARYVDFCNKCLSEEEERCIIFNFDSATKKQLLDTANRTFVAERKSKLLDVEALSRLLADNQVHSMKKLFQLLQQSKLDKDLKDPWEQYITAAGSKIVNDTNKADNMVVRLLLLRRDLDVMVRDAFDRNEEFTKGLREAFGHFVNDKKMNSTWGTGTSKVGEMVAKYIDRLLRGGLKALPPALLSDAKDRQDAERTGHASSGDSQDAELDRQLDNALELFRFIEGKDVFEAFYKKDLAKRLLMNRSASQDAERNMLAKFRGECGSNFTQNLEQMFKDRELADGDMKAYKEYREGRGVKSGVDLQVSILSAAAWPTYPEVPCKLPQEVQAQIVQFDKYYLSKHTGRRLTWKHNLAQCLVRAQFKRGSKELLVGGFQAIILLLFNDTLDITAEEVAKQTGIPNPDLNLTLQSLALGKSRVLKKAPMSKEVSPMDVFTVNTSFWDPKYRVKINMIQMKETPQENKETHERVAADRMFETQAAIVRILKSRKQISHNELVAEVISATKKRGAIDVSVIKQNIEKYAFLSQLAWTEIVTNIVRRLIDKDYMERDSETGEYVYMA